MKLQMIALYPGRLTDLLSQSGVKERKRKGGSWTQAPYELVTDDRASLAKPVHVAPEGAPRPVFKAQLELLKAEDGGKIVTVVLSSEGAQTADPEQRVLTPMYNNGRRLVFEFQRAEILVVTVEGLVELRQVAIHPVTGAVGTTTKYPFHASFAKLVARCQSHLAGSIDLFPAQDHAAARVNDFHVPSGPANLDLGRLSGLASTKSRPRIPNS
jgi:hypothetical protein